LKNKIQTIFVLENPEMNIIKFATDYQLRYDDIVKEVFGVACIQDLQMMIKMNKSFQESICKTKGINNENITLDNIVHIASKDELLQLRRQMIMEKGCSAEDSVAVARPFDTLIQLQEGIFTWDERNSAYIQNR
jgi:hypothetical protein